jgi:hypothetical protein
VVPASSRIAKGPTVPGSSDSIPPRGDDPSPWRSTRKAVLSPMHARVLERLREAFGPPNRRVDGRSINWSLREGVANTSVNLVLSSDEEFPIVWIFDPRDPLNGVTANAVLDDATLTEVIANIQRRVRGGQPGRN